MKAGPFQYLLAFSLLGFTTATEARVLKTFTDAVQQVFPSADNLKRQSNYLTKEEMARAAKLAGEPVESALVVSYRVTRGGAFLGWAYLDTHKVRTLNETVLFCVDDKARITHVEVLSFAEPQEYLAPNRFLNLFKSHGLDENLSTRGSMPFVTGETLTCTAIVAAARRVLAVHKVLSERGPGAGT